MTGAPAAVLSDSATWRLGDVLSGAPGRARAAVVGLVLAVLAHPGAAAAQATAAGLRVGISSARPSIPLAPLVVPATQEATAPRGVSTAEILGGVAGSAVGMWGGVLAGLAVYEAAGSRCTSGCEDGGLGEGVVGLVVGSIVGTAFGTHFGAKVARRPTGGFGKRVLAGGLGFLAGLAAFEVFGHDADQAIPLIAFPVAQGVVGALLGRP